MNKRAKQPNRKTYIIQITKVVGIRLEVARIECDSMKEAQTFLKEIRKNNPDIFIKIYDKDNRVVHYEVVYENTYA